MSRDMIGGAIVAAGVWAIFAAGVMGLTPSTPHGDAWTVTGSEMFRSHPELVRIAPSSDIAVTSNKAEENSRLPEG